MTKIKICGLTREEDAALAVELGADFLGLIFVRESPRYVTVERAREIVAASREVLAKSASIAAASRPLFVGVFRNEPPAEMSAIAGEVGLDMIQLHGNEPESVVAALALPVIRAVDVGTTLPEIESSAAWMLFDTGGGTGRTFDWTLLEDHPRTKPFFLAGGLRPENVTDAIRIARPDAIDLSSGIESAPGVKDHQRMRDLFARVRP